ncbi:hypothetical protein [Leptolyngbya sp. FACHB-711]|jgi:hypothetical protein|uniref:hypothetical protein n=1 Tax=unclassified Leptolyngbya TaxID=2650499 RepID=UPI00168341C5|nr:hypothetical protein [Leptolyngbya sp. FACHB-711]MBD1852218.1 hypothetical protein [Cyanobacteria bacterium FACHB-502]MBD2027379.1 hypothetical protein [Leptolyngbya sp. FACHB-711]
MESGSQASEPPGRAALRVADVAGTLIALLTLLTPIVTIAYFSSVNAQSLQSPPMTVESK